MRENYIQGIFNEYMGLRDQARADLEVFLTNPVGIGEHPDISVEIKKKIEQIERYDSLVQQMNKLFLSRPEGTEPADDDV